MNTQTQYLQPAELSRNQVPRYRAWPVYLASILYGILVIVLDRSIDDVVITPMLVLWWMMGVAFFRRPVEITIIGVILFGFVVYSLVDDNILTILVRCVSFVISSALAVLFGVQRCRTAERFRQISKIIRSVPASVVAADEQGTIIAASQMAEDLAGDVFKPLCGHVFTDVFMHHYPPASALRIYRNWFGMTGRFDCDIRSTGRGDVPLKCTGECSGTGATRILVFMFNPGA